MKNKRIIAKVVEPGDCKYYLKGNKVILSDPKPDDVCESGYEELMRQAQAFIDDENILKVGSGKIVTRCPHYNGDVWELSLEDI
ncbi:MAG: hypothetical protein FVQ80_09530 [Planctomycetes bacterium]|nr:hypothetical protein [Planctomycetota bacterium]